jgi:hypothetical protein
VGKARVPGDGTLVKRDIGRGPGRGGGAGGFAVAAVLLLLIGLTALAHGALVLAERERAASALEAKLIARRLLARSVVGAAGGADTLPTLTRAPIVLRSGARGLLRWATEAIALDRELALLTGVGRVEGLPGDHRTAVIVSALDPTARAAEVRAVVEVGAGADLSGGAVSTAGWLSPPDPGSGEACAPELAALDSLNARTPLPLGALPTTGDTPSGAVPALGPLSGDTVLERVRPRIEGTFAPRPRLLLGDCLDAPDNWGSPTDPRGPCGGRMTLAAADGDLTLAGGEGQGTIVVAGDLVLRDAARFHGLALVGGDLVLEGSSTLVGAARVGGAMRLRGGTVDGSACAVARALRAALRLRWPLAVPNAGRVHPL